MQPTYVATVTDHCVADYATDPRPTEWKQLRSRGVGFNPFRQQDKTRTDVVVVVTFLVITLIVVVWAFVGN
jgi:hypothetical protein